MTDKVEHVLSVQNKLGEGPIWNTTERALYWVDIHRRNAACFHPDSGELRSYQFDFAITVLGLRAREGFVFAGDRGFGFWDGRSTNVQFLSNPEASKSRNRFNDGAVDPAGRFWAGTMCETTDNPPPVEGRLYRLDPDLSTHLMEEGLTISNGIGWSPDGETMYLTDTLRRIIWAYDYNIVDGSIANKRVFVEIAEADSFPDGMTVDSEGYIWSAFWGGWKICRFDPMGRLDRTLRLPVQYPTSVAFGGRELNELYITSAWTVMSRVQRSQQPLAGDLFRVVLDVRGTEENYFNG